jgi:paraquat-inducible protein A
VEVPLALFVAALVLLIPAVMLPVITVASFGAVHVSWIVTGASELWRQGFESLAFLLTLCVVLLPGVFLVLLIGALGAVYRGGTEFAGGALRWALALRPWMMLEVYLLGCCVAYSRLVAVSTVHIGAGGWCLLAAVFLVLLGLTQLDERTVWESLAVPHDTSGRPSIACLCCDRIAPVSAAGTRCPRCGSRLHARKPAARDLTMAMVLAAYLLYIPANLLPVLTIVQVGRIEEDTILGGVAALVRADLWPLAVVVFAASIAVPLFKLGSLTWMLLATTRASREQLLTRTRLYRFVDVVGRWSNIDVFMSAVLISVLQFGALTTVRIGPGLVAFAAVVVLTMIATTTFDPRLMWDAAKLERARA